MNSLKKSIVKIPDSSEGNFVIKYFPNWSIPYLYLSRADTQTATWLLLLPCLFGILLAFAMLFPHMQLMLLIPPIPIKAKYLVLVYGFYELWSEFNRMPGDNVAHLAHLGGMLIAYIILRYWKNKYGTYY